jgi:hypothetical protein
VNEILSKISSYNIFNYLFPGAVFAIFAKALGALDLPRGDIATTLLLYYFIGLSISRIGSVVLEPALMKLGFLRYSEYSDYVRASEKDVKIEVLVEVSNTYRTLASAFLLLPLTWLGRMVADGFALGANWRNIIVAGMLLLLFLLSFKKQSGYVANRVNHHSERP